MKTTIAYPVSSPSPCYDKNGRQIGWFNPRFLCTAVFVYAWSKTAKEWCVLAAVRGDGSGTFQGLMNCPCGYMDINVTMSENAAKELQEECGVIISPKDLHLMGIEDDPSAFEQHVTARYTTIIKDMDADEIIFSHENNEVDADGNLEVGHIGFVPLSEIKRFKWAFNHDNIALKYAKKLNLHYKTNWKLFKNKVFQVFN